jgi:hypothetical protein
MKNWKVSKANANIQDIKNTKIMILPYWKVEECDTWNKTHIIEYGNDVLRYCIVQARYEDVNAAVREIN